MAKGDEFLSIYVRRRGSRVSDHACRYVDASDPLWGAETTAGTEDEAGAVRDSALAGLRLLIVAGSDLYQRFVEETAPNWGIAHSHAERPQDALEMLRAAATKASRTNNMTKLSFASAGPCSSSRHESCPA
ncbi:MAG: hypothetical protein M3495_16165 [Pseudomonadota bacterium]|nr:hypothetical protein [Pseudomonadota bacterium]